MTMIGKNCVDTAAEHNRKTIVSFQGLRGYAILLIFLSHCGNFVINSHGENALAYLGGLGVSLFILLSGFLLMNNYYYKEPPVAIELFKNKLKKFYPLHILTLILAVPFSIKGFSIYSILKLICNLFLVQDWIPISSFYFSYNSVSWYLSLEVFFILLTPFIARKFKYTPNKIVYSILFIVPLFEILFCVLVENYEISHWLVYIFPVIRALDLIFGVCIYIMLNNHHKLIEKNSVIILITSLLITVSLIVLSLERQSELFSTALWTIPCGMIILSLAAGDKTSNIIKMLFENKLILFIGNISFEIFLIHQLVIRYLTAFTEKVLKPLVQVEYIYIYIYIYSRC